MTREQVAFFALRNETVLPPFLWHSADTTSSFDVYGLPDSSGVVKIGHHQAGPSVQPGGYADPDPVRTTAISSFVTAHLPSLMPQPQGAKTCLYATTPDDDFIIDRVGHIILAIGFGGHGFKFAPAVGDLVADLIDSHRVPEYGAKFALPRFANLNVSAGRGSYAT